MEIKGIERRFTPRTDGKIALIVKRCFLCYAEWQQKSDRGAGNKRQGIMAGF